MKLLQDTFQCQIKKQKMTMKTKVILAGILACIGITAQAQDAKVEEPKYC